MDGNRVDLGDVKGKQGITGVGIASVVEMPPDEANLKRVFRVYYTDSTNENPHYFEYKLTEQEYITRLNELSVGNPSSDQRNVPTIYLLKNELNKRPLNNDVYRKEFVYTKTETDQAIASAISELELVEIVNSLPQSNIKNNRLYMVKKNTDSSDGLDNRFDLYIYAENEWKKLDDLSFSIADYYTSSTIESKLTAKQSVSNISNNVSSDANSSTKYPSVFAIKTYVDTKVLTDLSNYYTKSEVDSMIGDIQEFIHS